MLPVKDLGQASLYSFVISWLPAILGCNLEGMQVCPFNSEFKQPIFSVMFSSQISQYRKMCQQQQTFLDCAWQDDYIQGCSHEKLASLLSFTNVYKAVCEDNIRAYNRSRPCILELETEVRNCYLPFKKAREDYCLVMETTRECVRLSVKGKELCDDVDKIFLGKIADLSLSPFAHALLFDCVMTTFAGEWKAVTTFQAETTRLEAETTTLEAETTTLEAETTTLEAETTTLEAVRAVSTSVVAYVANTEKAKVAASNGTLMLAITDDNNSGRHSTGIASITALFVTFLSVYV